MTNIYGKVDKVLEDLGKTIKNGPTGHGDPVIFVEVFTGMMRHYIDGILRTGRGLQDLDGFVILSMMKMARQSVGGPVPFYDHALNAAGYQVLKAAATLPDNAVAPGTAPPVIQSVFDPPPPQAYYVDDHLVGNRSGEFLLTWAKQNVPEGGKLPADWTPAEIARFMAAMQAEKDAWAAQPATDEAQKASPAPAVDLDALQREIAAEKLPEAVDGPTDALQAMAARTRALRGGRGEDDPVA